MHFQQNLAKITIKSQNMSIKIKLFIKKCTFIKYLKFSVQIKWIQA